ncbi:MAG: peptidyl-prolyl cis-trans isomerase [Planctomycetes bacterium]|nr:peptidyl-prolyl cis-trans isomerase [Planctomycetota bacterium]
MFKLMHRWQKPVLICAGLATALLFGVSVQDVKSLFNPPSPTDDLSKEEIRTIGEKLKLRSLLTGQNIPGDSWDPMVADYAKRLRVAKEQGLAVSNHEVGLSIIENFKSKQAYENFLRNFQARTGASTTLLENYLRDSVLFQKSAALKMLPSYVTKGEIMEEYHRMNDTVEYDLFQITNASIEIDQNFSEEEQKSLYESQKETPDFMELEKVELEYLHINSDLLVIENPSEEDQRYYYNKNRDKYSSTEFPGEAKPYFEVQEDVERDLIRERRDNKAKDMMTALDFSILDQDVIDLKKGLEAEKASDPVFELVKHGVTKAISERDYQVEPMGFIYGLSQKLFGEKAREYGGVNQASPGYFIYKVKNRIETHSKSYEDCAELIIGQLTQQKQEEEADKLMNIWQSTLSSTSDWGTLDLTQNLALKYSSEKVEGLFSAEANKAVEAGVGEISEPISAAGSKSVVRLKVLTPADEEALKDSEEQIKSTLGSRKAQSIQFAEYSLQ